MMQENFGRNIQLDPKDYRTPKTEAEVLEILEEFRSDERRGRGSIRCVGRLHSWSRVLQGPDLLLNLRHLDQVRPFERDGQKFVEVGAGCQIKQVLSALDRQKGWTLPSVGFITEQTVAGAISTGTHGSGRHSLSHYVTALRVARFDPTTGRVTVSEISEGDSLRAARCSLGCLGVILSVTMQARESYSVEEHFHEYSKLEEVLNAEGDFPLQQFFWVPWRWKFFGQHRREVNEGNSSLVGIYQWYRYLVFDVLMHFLVIVSVRWIKSAWLLRTLFRWVLPSFVIRDWKTVGPSSTQLVMEHELFRHMEIELFAAREQLEPALEFLRATLEVAGGATPQEEFMAQVQRAGCEEGLASVRGRYVHHYPICVRKILSDETLISMASDATSVPEEACSVDGHAWYSITLTNYQRRRDGDSFLALSEFLAVSMARLFEVRPHWGKINPVTASELVSLYPGFERFQALCAEMDPEGVFPNAWTRELLKNGSEGGPVERAE